MVREGGFGEQRWWGGGCVEQGWWGEGVVSRGGREEGVVSRGSGEGVQWAEAVGRGGGEWRWTGREVCMCGEQRQWGTTQTLHWTCISYSQLFLALETRCLWLVCDCGGV